MARPSTSTRDTDVLAGRYRLREAIGSGGMATVWLATDERLDRDVAVKLLAEGLTEDPAFVARFRREARVAASLRHANLVGVFDFDPEATPPYLVMEYVPGPNLAERLEGGTPPSVERLAGDLLSALEAIHRAGVVHRDVKPQNVLLAPGGRAMLTDFGIARPQDASSITQTGQMPGTARYMAPELLEGMPATPASDLYACGVVLGECLEEGGDSSLSQFAGRLTATDPMLRPASAAAALEELLHHRDRFEVPAAPAAPPERPPEVRTIHIERSRLVAAAALIAAAGLVALLIALSGDADPERVPPGMETRATGTGSDQPDPERERSLGAAVDRSDSGAGRRAAIPPPAADPDPARGAALDQEGRALIDAGQPEEAIGVLRDAVGSFPAGTDDLNYAYALFNLGQALRLAGRPEEAIPVLRQRLEIPDQTATVQAELEAAQAAAD